ncbi:hypothetical protein Tco_1077364 [Tanacetum coccineum]
MFLQNLQPEWQRFTITIRQHQDLKRLDIDSLFDILKHNQEEVNDMREELKNKEKSVNDLLALQPSEYAEQEHAQHDHSSKALAEILHNMALLGKQIQKSFYKKPTNNSLFTTLALTAVNKR